jgi:uncharacterized protein (DUF3084 family)
MAEGTATAGNNPNEGDGAQGGGQGGFTPITTQEDFDKLSASIRRAEKAKYEKYADYDALKAKADELDALQAASQTELQKAEARAQNAETKLKDFEQRERVEAWKAEVAEATGVKAALLMGATKEEIEKHAQAIKEAYEPPAAPIVGSDGQKPNVPPAEEDWIRKGFAGK